MDRASQIQANVDEWAEGHRRWMKEAINDCGHHEMYTGKNGCVSCQVESKYLSLDEALAEAYPAPVAPLRAQLLADEGRTVDLTNGHRGARRPLSDVGWGVERHQKYLAKCASLAAVGQLQIDQLGAATVDISFPPAAGKGAARALAARQIAATFGVDVTYTGARELVAAGLADDVARFAAGLGRVLNYAEETVRIAMIRYGKWARSPRGATALAGLEPAQLKAKARAYRQAAFVAVVDVLTGPEGAPVAAFEEGRPFGDQPAAYAGQLAEYGWVEVFEAYDPDEARALLAAAVVEQAPADLVVVIPCSGPKLTYAAPAGDLYTGPLHRSARRAADALVAGGGRVLVMSALHGLLDLQEEVAPYDHTWKDAGHVQVDTIRDQARALGVAGAGRVVLLTPGDYTARGLEVWPDAATPLAGLGIGSQRGVCKQIREGRHALAGGRPEYRLAA